MSNRPDKKIDIAELIKSWETEAVAARDSQINTILGERWQTKFRGMAGLVRAALLYYTPQNWDLPMNDGSIRGKTQDSIVYPYFFSNIQTTLPDILPKNLKLAAVPLRGDKKQLASMSTAILSEESETLKFPQFVRDYALDAKLHGSSIAYCGHSFRSGIISVDRTLEVCDPMSVLVDPLAKSLEDSAYIIWKRYRLISDIKSEYDITFEIEPLAIAPEFLSDCATGKQELLSTESAPRCVETIVFLRDNSVSKHVKKIEAEISLQNVETLEVEVKTIPIDYVNPETGKREFEEEAKFPNGRMIVMINDQIVFDDENPYAHKKIPFVKLDNHRIRGMFYAMPEWLAAGDIPMVINESASALQRDMRTAVNKTAIDPDLIEGEVDEISTDPAKLVIMKVGSSGKPPTHSFKLGGGTGEAAQNFARAVEAGQLITGVTDASRGMGDPNVTSGKQQQYLSEKSSRRNELFSSQLQESLEEVGYRMLLNAVQFRDENETLEIASNISDPQAFSIKDFPLDVEFHVKLIAGSGLPQDRQERLKVLNELMTRVGEIYVAWGEKAARIFASLTDIEEIDQFVDALAEREKQMMTQQVPIPQGTVNPPITS